MLSQPTLFFHTHWDREWYRPFRDYQHRLLRVVDRLLDLLEDNTLDCFTLDGQTVLLDDYVPLRPEGKARVKALVGAGRLSIGPWFVMPDEFLVSGESLIRNLELGMATSRAFGQQTFTGYLPDTFGHSTDMPMILSLFGIDSAVVWRGVVPQSSIFLWQSPSGHGVSTLHLTESYFQNTLHMAKDDDEATTNALTIAEKISAAHTATTHYLFPIGGDHLGIDTLVLNRAQKAFPKAALTTVDRYMSALVQTIQVENLPTVVGELSDYGGQYILPGVYSARMYLKQANKYLEWLLAQKLEPMLLLGKSLGVTKLARTQAQQDLLWRQLLLNHPHDSICGCSVDEVHRENEVRFEEVAQGSANLLRDTEFDLWRAFFQPVEPAVETDPLKTTASHDDILLFNMSDVSYRGVVLCDLTHPQETLVTSLSTACEQTLSQEIVLDETYLFDLLTLPLSENKVLQEKRLLWVDEPIPPRGVARYTAFSKTLPAAVHPVVVDTNVLQNDILRFSVGDDGQLTVLEHATGKRYTGVHHVIRTRQQGDSYNAAPVPGSSPEVAQLESVHVLHAGPLRGTLRLLYRFPLSRLAVECDVSLDAGAKALCFETRFTNTLRQHQIQVTFPSLHPITTVHAEGHFNMVERQYDPHYRLEDAMPVAPQKELKSHTGPIQRFVQWQNQALITRGLTEYEVLGNEMRLTLMRAFGDLSRDDTGVRGSHAGPPLATPEGQCLNRAFVCQYRWQPFGDDDTHAQLYHDANQFYGAVWAKQFDPRLRDKLALKEKPALSESFSLVSLDNPALHVTALQPLTSQGQGRGRYCARLRVMNPTAVVQRATVSHAFGASAQLKRLMLGQGDLQELPPAENLQTFLIEIPPKSVASYEIIQ